MQLTINEKSYLMLKATAELMIENKEVNANSISIKAKVDWKTAKKFIINNFNIKELEI